MSKKHIDERDLRKLTDEEEFDVSTNVSFNLASFEPSSLDTNFESELLSNIKESGDIKLDDGFYLVDSRIYMSIYSFKKRKKTDTPNTNTTNFNDAKSLYENGLAANTIVVHTHSPHFPKVNGYLEKELTVFYRNYKRFSGYIKPKNRHLRY